MNYDLTGFAFIGTGSQLMIPLYRRGSENSMYVALTDRAFVIEKFLQWVVPEDFIIENCNNAFFESIDICKRKVGDSELLAFRLHETIYVHSAHRIKEIYSEIPSKINGTLLDIQLGRAARMPLSQMYDKFVKFSSDTFRSERSSRLYVKACVSLAQNENSIWDSIDRQKSKFRSDADEKIRQILSLEKEALIQWLLDNVGAEIWPHVWSSAEERVGLEERLEEVALRWLASVDGEWLEDRHGCDLFRRMLAFYRLDRECPFEFEEMLLTLISSDELFSPSSLLRSSDYHYIFDIISKSIHFGSIERINYLVSSLRRSPYDSSFIEFCCRSLASEIRDADLSNYSSLKLSIVEYVLRNPRILTYRTFSNIRKTLDELKHIMRFRHSYR